jgi:hypothetical protein
MVICAIMPAHVNLLMFAFMDGDKVHNSVCDIGMITKFVLLGLGNTLFVTVTFALLSQVA